MTSALDKCCFFGFFSHAKQQGRNRNKFSDRQICLLNPRDPALVSILCILCFYHFLSMFVPSGGQCQTTRSFCKTWISLIMQDLKGIEFRGDYVFPPHLNPPNARCIQDTEVPEQVCQFCLGIWNWSGPLFWYNLHSIRTNSIQVLQDMFTVSCLNSNAARSPDEVSPFSLLCHQDISRWTWGKTTNTCTPRAPI